MPNVTTNKAGYMKGQATGVVSKSAYLQGKLTSSAKTTAYTRGQILARGKVSSYIRGWSAKMAISGQKTIGTAGQAEPLGTLYIGGPVIIKALSTNTGAVYIGNDGSGDITTTTGLQLAAKESVTIQSVGSLGEIWLDVANSNDGVSWMKLDL